MLTNLTARPPEAVCPRPAGMGPACDCFERNPGRGAYLRRCPNEAVARLVIQTPTDVYAVKRCPAHLAELKHRVANGETIEILSEEPINTAR